MVMNPFLTILKKQLIERRGFVRAGRAEFFLRPRWVRFRQGDVTVACCQELGVNYGNIHENQK